MGLLELDCGGGERSELSVFCPDVFVGCIVLHPGARGGRGCKVQQRGGGCNLCNKLKLSLMHNHKEETAGVARLGRRNRHHR